MKLTALAVILLASACTGRGIGVGDTNGDHRGATLGENSCRLPPGATASADASTMGCSATPSFQICDKGSADGPNCSDACASNEYALSCNQTAPDDAWGCRIITIPTPRDWLFYCCPCG